MENPAEKAIASFRRWSISFNTRDTEAQLAEMHFPHLRLAQNRFQRWATPEDFSVAQDENTQRLKQEGWNHTSTLSVDPIQVGADKVHLAIRQSRRHADGRVQ